MDALEPAATEGQSSSEHLSHSGNPGAAAPLVAPGSTNVLPPSQKTTRDNCKVSRMKPTNQKI